MTKNAISVKGLGKSYTIGHKKQGDLRHSLGDKIKGLFRPDASEKEIFWALKDIDFEIKHGEAVGIIGRNGAGKSTLLKILSRITEPSTGRFEINGRVSSLLEVGTGFHMELSGRENIYLNGTILGMKRAEIKQKFDEIVDFSGVEKFLDTPVKHYSSGMKVRLAFSVAAHLEPEILIIDEVLAVGDAEFQKKCLGKMDQVSKNEGRTVLFVSHNMGAVKNLCKTSILMNSGSISLTGDSEDIIDSYLSKFNVTEFKTELFTRTGAQKVKITDFKLFNQKEQEIHNVISGSEVNFVLKYASELKVINSLVLGITITNNLGQFITVLNNQFSNFPFQKINGTGTIVCTIPRIPLMYGTHHINFKLYANGEAQDIIEEAKTIFVENADYYNSGHINIDKRQGIYIEQKWKIG